MNLYEAVKPVSYVRTHATQLLAELEETRNPLVITHNGEAKAVMLDIREFDAMNRGIALLKRLAVSSADVQAGRERDADDVFADLRTMLEEN